MKLSLRLFTVVSFVNALLFLLLIPSEPPFQGKDFTNREELRKLRPDAPPISDAEENRRLNEHIDEENREHKVRQHHWHNAIRVFALPYYMAGVILSGVFIFRMFILKRRQVLAWVLAVACFLLSALMLQQTVVLDSGWGFDHEAHFWILSSLALGVMSMLLIWAGPLLGVLPSSGESWREFQSYIMTGSSVEVGFGKITSTISYNTGTEQQHRLQTPIRKLFFNVRMLLAFKNIMLCAFGAVAGTLLLALVLSLLLGAVGIEIHKITIHVLLFYVPIWLWLLASYYFGLQRNVLQFQHLQARRERGARVVVTEPKVLAMLRS